MSRAMGSHQSARAKTTTWLTPPDLVEKLGPFDLDPCAAPSPRPWPTAGRHIELPEDGLSADWDGHVWLNPPYSFAAWKWLARLAEHGDGIALIFARTETAGFVREVWGKATSVLFLAGRLHFHYADGTRADANSGAPSVLVAYGAGARSDARVNLACGHLREAARAGTFRPRDGQVGSAMSRRDRWAYVNGRPPWMRRERNHIARLAILCGLTVALITHAALTVLFSPNRRNR